MLSCRSVDSTWASVSGLVLLTTAIGCGPGGVGPPPVDPEAATDAALAEMDKNGDGALDRDELVASPALLNALAEYDTTGDRKIDREELLFRLAAMYDAGVGLSSATVTVTLDNRPLEGAHVWYVPEGFLGEGTTEKAVGVTDRSGRARMRTPPEKLPKEYRKHGLMQVGVFRVEITHPDQEIPAKYNKNTELGFEVHPDAHEGQDARFDLQSK